MLLVFGPALPGCRPLQDFTLTTAQNGIEKSAWLQAAARLNYPEKSAWLQAAARLNYPYRPNIIMHSCLAAGRCRIRLSPSSSRL